MNTMSMAAMAMVLLWKIAEDFQFFCERYETMSVTLNIWILQENGFIKSSNKSCLIESLFFGLHILFHTILGQTIYWSTAKPRTSPKNVQMTLNDQSFVSKFKVSFVVLPEDMWHSNFGKFLKIPQRTLVPKKNFFPKNFELCAKFCGVQSKPDWRYEQEKKKYSAKRWYSTKTVLFC
jgi:hypothetical protein